VSPEVLKGEQSSFATDLFSYGCVLYQMVCGSPAFGGKNENEFVIFQKIQNIDLSFPDNFDKDARDLVEKLIVLNPIERLGANDPHDKLYESIRSHKFFESIDFETIFSQTSPMQKLKDNENELFTIPDDFETGLGERQLKRILEMELKIASSCITTDDNTIDIEDVDNPLKKLLNDQKKIPWSQFVAEDECIIKYGLIKKKKCLIKRERMFILTNQPRLIYIDANTNEKKGEIPFDSSITCEPRNFKIFFVHTKNRKYFLEDPQGNALKWCELIEKCRDQYCKE
jgi:3-phosphoinositide dependent protein kinase-1